MNQMEKMSGQIPQSSPEFDLKFAETPEQREALQKLIKLVQASRDGRVVEEPEDEANTERKSDSNIDGNLDKTVRKLGV